MRKLGITPTLTAGPVTVNTDFAQVEATGKSSTSPAFFILPDKREFFLEPAASALGTPGRRAVFDSRRGVGSTRAGATCDPRRGDCVTGAWVRDNRQSSKPDGGRRRRQQAVRTGPTRPVRSDYSRCIGQQLRAGPKCHEASSAGGLDVSIRPLVVHTGRTGSPKVWSICRVCPRRRSPGIRSPGGLFDALPKTIVRQFVSPLPNLMRALSRRWLAAQYGDGRRPGHVSTSMPRPGVWGIRQWI